MEPVGETFFVNMLEQLSIYKGFFKRNNLSIVMLSIVCIKTLTYLSEQKVEQQLADHGAVRIKGFGAESVWGAPWSRPVPLALTLVWGWVANLHIAEKIGIPLPRLLGEGHEVKAVTHAVSTVTALWLAAVFLVPHSSSSGFTLGSTDTVDPGRHMLVLVGIVCLVVMPMRCCGSSIGRLLQMDREMRKMFRKITADIVFFSPFATVTFFHVLVADCACSMAKNFADVYVGACVAFDASIPSVGVTVQQSDASAYDCILHPWTSVAISLPTLWRMGQCFWRYGNEGVNHELCLGSGL